ncbi:adenosine deaminase [Rhizobium sp. S153]|uniref:Adenosine deaminase n=1 Tax=Ciceribacter sichuanensis TaxID=2949647 RepID=A0ABT0VA16_9HYPH|nr:adenosine deaminase [Ciceribacter sp. S153]MCM2402676.1 adenosine deaminase [Ciceribacter sp. S153]
MDFLSLPKAEIHIHLEGCFDPEDIEALAKDAGVPLPRSRENLYDTSGLSNFLAFLDWTCGLVRFREQLAGAAYAFSRRMHLSGVRYADVIVNPTHWTHWHHRIPDMIDALDGGFAEAEEDGFAPAKLCISLLRKQTSEQAIELVELLTALKHPRVVALSVDGNEAAAGRTGPRFAEAYRRAAQAGLRRTAHAGESSGPEGVRDALDFLRVERIDHGVRVIEDAELVKRLVDEQIALGITPTSNITLGLYGGYDSHPFEALRKAGVPVSVNTDDPSPLSISLPQEYANMANANGWDKETVRAVARTSITASFAEPELKASMLRDLADW